MPIRRLAFHIPTWSTSRALLDSAGLKTGLTHNLPFRMNQATRNLRLITILEPAAPAASYRLEARSTMA